jgi:protocatechuate 3,4-dioxygenase beta subunit
MDRKDFLRGIGIAGIGTMLPATKTKAALNKIAKAQLPSGTCILIPQETAGPYPFDLSNNSNMFRQDITEGKPGSPMTLTLTVVNINDQCNPIPNARVDIWHCDVDGYYSEYQVSGYLGTQNNVGQTFFRGIQITDQAGQVQFTTIYPGWYNGRAVHIHFQVFLNSVLSATSQLCFPDSMNTLVNNTSLYSAHGQNPTTNSNDNVFSDANNTQYETATVASNGSGGYDASLMIGISVPVTGVINLEPETGGQFKLYQNYPNPAKDYTEIPFVLNNAADVKIEIFDLSARKVLVLLDESMQPGEHKARLDRNGKHEISSGSYIYQITVRNNKGTFMQCKSMLIY